MSVEGGCPDIYLHFVWKFDPVGCGIGVNQWLGFVAILGSVIAGMVGDHALDVCVKCIAFFPRTIIDFDTEKKSH